VSSTDFRHGALLIDRARTSTPATEARPGDARGPYAEGMEIPKEAQRRIDEDRVVWLTTVTDSGVPAPNPVWFVPDGED
jgi:hypothetical protein